MDRVHKEVHGLGPLREVVHFLVYVPIERYVLHMHAFLPFSELEIQLFCLWIAVNAIYFFSLLKEKKLGWLLHLETKRG